MDTVFVWTLIAMLTVIAYATRASFILIFAKVSLPGSVQASLRFVPAAVFMALLMPDLLMPEGALQLGLHANPKAAAAALAAFIAWRTQNTLITVIAGMVCLHLLRFLAS